MGTRLPFERSWLEDQIAVQQSILATLPANAVMNRTSAQCRLRSLQVELDELGPDDGAENTPSFSLSKWAIAAECSAMWPPERTTVMNDSDHWPDTPVIAWGWPSKGVLVLARADGLGCACMDDFGEIDGSLLMPFQLLTLLNKFATEPRSSAFTKEMK